MPGLIPFTIYFTALLVYTDYIAYCEEGRCQINLTEEVILYAGSVIVILWLYFTYFEIV